VETGKVTPKVKQPYSVALNSQTEFIQPINNHQSSFGLSILELVYFFVKRPCCYLGYSRLQYKSLQCIKETQNHFCS